LEVLAVPGDQGAHRLVHGLDVERDQELRVVDGGAVHEDLDELHDLLRVVLDQEVLESVEEDHAVLLPAHEPLDLLDEGAEVRRVHGLLPVAAAEPEDGAILPAVALPALARTQTGDPATL